MTESQALTSPCISQCCLDDDDICVGCKRHIDEITGWHSATKPERLDILRRCAQRGNIALRFISD